VTDPAQRPQTPPRTPVVGGALGQHDPALVASLGAALGGPLREVHRDGASVLMLDRDPIHWQGDGTRGLAWSESPPSRAHSARSWQDAATLGACGLELADDGGRRLHSSVSGIAPLYWMCRDGALYFANRWDALAEAVAATLTPDWESWASIFVLGSPAGDGTPFAEIRRSLPYSAIDIAPDTKPRVLTETWPWAEVEPEGGDGVPAAIIARLTELLAELPPDEPVICPLSGGWDSRVLACLLAKRRDDVVAWTVNTDLGDDIEQQIAAEVATALGLQHRLVDRPKRRFSAQFEETVQMVGHETQPHLPMAWLADRFRDEPGVIVDGIAGDMLIKGLMTLVKGREDVTEEMILSTSGAQLVSFLASTTSTPRRRAAAFSAAAGPVFAALAEHALAREASRFDGHPSASLLTLYWTRTRRYISPSPVSILGRDHAVAMPFADHELAMHALSVSPRAKVGGALYRDLLRQLDPRVGPMASTNDKLTFKPEWRRRVQRGPMARQTYAGILTRSPLRPWLSPTLEEALTSGRLGLLVRPPMMLRELHAICGLSLLTERFAGRMDPTLPDLGDLTP
jgi:hypothetical protein